MTGQDLIEFLESLTPEQLQMEIVVAQPTHDHWGSVISSSVDSVEECKVKHSEYHRADQLVDEDDHLDEDEMQALKTVLVIK